jgi:hypothetical protein
LARHLAAVGKGLWSRDVRIRLVRCKSLRPAVEGYIARGHALGPPSSSSASASKAKIRGRSPLLRRTPRGTSGQEVAGGCKRRRTRGVVLWTEIAGDFPGGRRPARASSSFPAGNSLIRLPPLTKTRAIVICPAQMSREPPLPGAGEAACHRAAESPACGTGVCQLATIAAGTGFDVWLSPVGSQARALDRNFSCGRSPNSLTCFKYSRRRRGPTTDADLPRASSQRPPGPQVGHALSVARMGLGLPGG